MRGTFTIFFTALAQVLFVTITTFFIANDQMVKALFSSFMINIIWSFNVKRIAFSTVTDRVVYAVGASTGTALGFIAGRLLNDI